jgi:hypothetical protein
VPTLSGQVITPNNYTLPSHRRLCSLSVAFYDSQGLRWRYSNPPPHGGLHFQVGCWILYSCPAVPPICPHFSSSKPLSWLVWINKEDATRISLSLYQSVIIYIFLSQNWTLSFFNCVRNGNNWIAVHRLFWKKNSWCQFRFNIGIYRVSYFSWETYAFSLLVFGPHNMHSSSCLRLECGLN